MLAGLLAFSSGCHSPYGYQSPYPYGQQPVYPGGPGYVIPPGQPYVPGGSTPGSGGPTLIPPSGSGTNTYDNGGNGSGSGSPANTGGGIKFDDAPPFNPNPGSTPPAGDSGSNRVVPDPLEDLNNNSGPAASQPKLSPTSSQREQLESPFRQESNRNGASPPEQLPTESDPFEVPDKVSSIGEPARTAIQKVNLEVPQRLNPYGRDTEHANPSWLRGVVNFDPQEKTWQIIYSNKPDSRDRNGGSLTLADHPDLAQCRDGDVVLVEGAIDAGQTDTRGKPVYALDKVTPLTAE
jgi:hypothetical protein